MDVRKIKKIMELLEAHGIAEIDISEGDQSIRMTRHAAAGTESAPPLPAGVQAPQAPSEHATAEPAAASRGHEITSPMVGTFYSGPTPGAKPFVDLGTEVKLGATLCIIEAMKMMNPIEADVEGRVVSILVENGAPVEFGQVLFIVEQ